MNTSHGAIPRLPAMTLALLGILVGCSAGSADTRYEGSASSGGEGETTTQSRTTTAAETAQRDATGGASVGGMAPATSATTPRSGPTSPANMTQFETGAQATIARDDAIRDWSQRLAAAELQLQASAGVCRDVCRAAASICQAARELCALTGDREGAPPTDPRCARARASCERASRQRDGTCPSCPSE
jgi:hypothetical protein